MKRQVRKKMPQIAVLLETSHGISRLELQGILKYVRVYGPWSIHNTVGSTHDLKMPDLRHWKGQGIIGRVTSDAMARAIIAARLPTVLFNPSDRYLLPTHPLAKCSRTKSDSAAIGKIAAEYYLAKKFTRFAFVGEVQNINWSRAREVSYVAHLNEAGQTCHVYPLPPQPQTKWDAERPLLCKWLKKLPKPIALFAANDYRARQILDACLVMNIAVPHEIAVLGVNNDVLICETCIPPLSSIALNAEHAGYEAARMLDEQMHHPKRPQEIISYGPTEIIARDSTDALHITDRLVIDALEFIRINKGLMIRVSDVAKHLNISCRWLEIRFQEALGYAIHDTIQRMRMESICTMLKETDLPLAVISRKCGFSMPNHLCTIFKRQFGYTMSDYRAQKKD